MEIPALSCVEFDATFSVGTLNNQHHRNESSLILASSSNANRATEFNAARRALFYSMNLGAHKGGHAPRLLLFVMLLSWCGTLLLFRFVRSGSLALGFLPWNLFLAAIPAVAAWFFARAMGKESSHIERG